MARTIDTTVTGGLPALLRLVETGPKICQKYIEKPALYQGRKFDLRYIVLLRSIQPLEIFLSDVFWVSSVFQVPPRNVEQVFLLVFVSGGQVYCLLLHDWLNCLAVFGEFWSHWRCKSPFWAPYASRGNKDMLLQARFSNNQYTTDKNTLSEYDTHFTVMVSDPATGRTVAGFSVHMLLVTLMRIHEVSVDILFSSRNTIFFLERYIIMWPHLS